MSDINSSILYQDIDKIIKETLKVWKEFGFKDLSLWKIFQEDFENFTEENFKSASTHYICKLRDYQQRLGV